MSDQKMKNPLVSVLIPTKDSADFLIKCLESIQKQTYKNIEVVVVDNFSTDQTEQVCKNFKAKYYKKGPERHAQRRYAVEKASGRCLLFVDTDMILEPKLISECVSITMNDEKAKAIIIPEVSIGRNNFWTKCKIFEKSFYHGCDQTESPRFICKKVYKKLGGHDANMISLEDFDLAKRLKSLDIEIKRTKSVFYHDEGYMTLKKQFQKKYYYGTHAHQYVKKHGKASIIKHIYFFRPAFYRNIPKMLKRPILTFGMSLLLFSGLIGGSLGYLKKTLSKIK